MTKNAEMKWDKIKGNSDVPGFCWGLVTSQERSGGKVSVGSEYGTSYVVERVQLPVVRDSNETWGDSDKM